MHTTSSSLLAACTIVFAACAARSSDNGSTTPEGVRGLDLDEAEPMLSLEIRAERLGLPHMLPQHGGSLYSRDRLWFDVELHEAAYVYILQVAPTGEAAVLFPPGGVDRKVEPGRARIPGKGTVRLDDQIGKETALLVATRVPIGQVKSAAALAAYFKPPPPAAAAPTMRSIDIETQYPERSTVTRLPRRVAQRPSLRVSSTRNFEWREELRTGDTRGMVYEAEYEGGEYGLFGQFDSDGVLVIPVTFDHLARP